MERAVLSHVSQSLSATVCVCTALLRTCGVARKTSVVGFLPFLSFPALTHDDSGCVVVAMHRSVLQLGVEFPPRFVDAAWRVRSMRSMQTAECGADCRAAERRAHLHTRVCVCALRRCCCCCCFLVLFLLFVLPWCSGVWCGVAQACRFETGHAVGFHLSPWCHAFSLVDMRMLDYLDRLETFWLKVRKVQSTCDTGCSVVLGGGSLLA